MRLAPDRQFDLEERTLTFAQRVRTFLKALPRSVANEVDLREVARSSGAIGACFIEAKDSATTKHRVLWLKAARKHAKATRYWLQLLDTDSLPAIEEERSALLAELVDMMNILLAIYRKLQSTQDA